MKAPKRQQSGLTLLEVLVALVLMTVLTGTLYAGMRVALRSWDAVEQRVAEREGERAARNRITRHLGTLLPERSGAANRVQLAFDGRADGVRFLGTLGHGARAGLYVIGIEARRTRGATALVLSLQLRDPEAGGLEGLGEGLSRELAGAFERVRFEYFGSSAEGAPPRWLSRWDGGATAYPQLVRIRAERTGGAPWPDLVIPIRPGAAA